MTLLTTLAPLIQINRKSKRGPKAKPKPIFVSRKIEVQYMTALLAISQQCQDAIDTDFLPVIMQRNIGDSALVVNDGFLDLVKSAMNKVSDKITKAVDSIALQIAQKIVANQKESSDDQLSAVIYKQTGIDLKGLLKDSEIKDALDEAISSNVSLIKSIPVQYFGKIETIVFNGLQSGQRASEIADEIKKLGQSTDSRAKLIALDQMGKINSRLSQVRQQSLGITHYTWVTSQDERVRHTHRARNGKLFAWNDPPSDGHPGIPIRCRCVAVPYTANLFDPAAPSPEEVMKQQVLPS